MRAFVIFALIAVAAARPDIGLQLQQGHQGYNYQQGGGSSSGGHSSGGHSSGGHSSGGHSSGGHSSDSGFSSGGNALGAGGGDRGSLFEGISSYDAPLVSGNSFGGSSGGGSFGGSSGGSFGGSSGGSSGGSFGGSSGGSFGGSSGGSFGGSSGGSFGGSSGGGSDGGVTQGQSQVIDISGGGSSNSVVYKPVIRQGPPQITKHFYVHEAPEEASNVEVREKEIQVRPQKHYKIIFIKAPSGGNAVAGGSAAIFPQSEEKTIVYVLSKKPEGVSENGEFPTPPAPVTSKPEVFFVKYKTQQEAEGAISTIQESFKEGGQGFNNPAGFAASLGASSGSASSSSFGGSSQGSSSGGRSDFGGSSQGGSSFGGSSQGGSFGGSNQGSSSQGGSFGGSSSGSTGGSFSGSNDAGSFRTSSSGFAANENSFSQPQQMIEIPSGDSEFRSVYLPPGK